MEDSWLMGLQAQPESPLRDNRGRGTLPAFFNDIVSFLTASSNGHQQGQRQLHQQGIVNQNVGQHHEYHHRNVYGDGVVGNNNSINNEVGRIQANDDAIIADSPSIDAPSTNFSPNSSLSDYSTAERVCAAVMMRQVQQQLAASGAVGDISPLSQTNNMVPARRKVSEEFSSNSSLMSTGSESAADGTCGGSASTSNYSQNSSSDYGWYDQNQLDDIISSRENDAAAVTAPTYVLEESLSSQRLWKDTAGQRPPQPVEERAFYEKLWAQNFARSQVNYKMPTEVLTATSPICLSPFETGFDNIAGSGAGSSGALSIHNYNYYDHESIQQPKYQENKWVDDHDNSASTSNLGSVHDDKGTDASTMMLWTDHQSAGTAADWDSNRHQHIVNKTVKDANNGDLLKVLVRGDNVFGTTVSKSFARTSEVDGSMIGIIDTVNVSIASYRVVESKKHGKYAQYLVIYREGSFHDTVGVWKRYSDFSNLSKKVTHAHESGCATAIVNTCMKDRHSSKIEHLPNAITSWRLLKKRRRWYRCLDAGYLSLKVFLLERFLHDILFESTTPTLLREFVGANPVSC